jgi:predicted GIY-YIG superfamily endonuclease
LRALPLVNEKRFVYVIRSERQPAQYYVGRTFNVVSRLASHNEGASPRTRGHRPWRLVVAMAFADEQRAAAFEKFLKSSSGAGLVRHHLL